MMPMHAVHAHLDDTLADEGSNMVRLSPVSSSSPVSVKRHILSASPLILVKSLEEMDREFSFIRRLADYELFNGLNYVVSAGRNYDGTELPASMRTISVSPIDRRDRLNELYTVMHAAVQHGQLFAYHFWREEGELVDPPVEFPDSVT